MTTLIVRNDEGRHHPMIDGDHVAKAVVSDSQGSFEVFEVHAPLLPAAPPHISPWTGVLYLLEGRVRVVCDDREDTLGPGDVATLPAGVACTFAPEGGPARFLAITSGGGAGRVFADFAASVPADAPVEEAFAEILAVAARHGVRVAGA